MKNYHELNELKGIQKSYCDLLLKLRNDINSENLKFVLDEVNLFWYKKRLTIRTILKYQIEPYNTIVFTGATRINFDIGEHLQFLVLGKIHIWDDPVFSYINFIGKIIDENLVNVFKDKILETIDNNILILEKYKDYIFILPIRFLTEDLNTIHSISKKLFVSLFKSDFNFEDFLKHYKTIDQIGKDIKDELNDNIKFILSKDEGIDFISSFNRFRERSDLSIGVQYNDNELFYNLIFGYICQAMGIFSMCLEFKLIPFLVNEITHGFFVLFYPTLLSKDNNIKLIVSRCSLLVIISNIMMRYDLNEINVEKFKLKLKESNTESKILETIKELDFQDKDSSSKEILYIVAKHIDNLMIEVLKQE